MQLDDPHHEGEHDPQDADLEGFIHAMLAKFYFYEDTDRSIYTCIKRRGQKAHVPERDRNLLCRQKELSACD
jgi:hypothetical protein